MKVFLDNNLSPHLAHALHTLLEPEGDRVIHLTDRFAPDTEDRVWIEALAAEGGWVVISADRRIDRNRLEREAWRRNRLIMFFLSRQWRRLRNVEIAWRLLRWWPSIEEQARLVSPPAAFELPRDYRSGRLKVLRWIPRVVPRKNPSGGGTPVSVRPMRRARQSGGVRRTRRQRILIQITAKAQFSFRRPSPDACASR